MTKTKRPYRIEFRSKNLRGEWSMWRFYSTVSTMAKATELVDAKRSVPWFSPKEWRIIFTYQTVLDY